MSMMERVRSACPNPSCWQSSCNDHVQMQRQGRAYKRFQEHMAKAMLNRSSYGSPFAKEGGS